MKFSTENVNETRPKKVAKLPVGINDDTYLISIVKGKTASDKEYVDFNVESEDKTSGHNKRIWFPDSDNPYLRKGETKEEASQREVNQGLEHIIHWMEVYLPTNKTIIVASSFEEFVDQAKARLDAAKVSNIKIRSKILYDGNGVYTQFPNFPPYAEKQIEGQKSRLFISGWEQENRMTASAPATDSPITGGPTKDTADEELPF